MKSLTQVKNLSNVTVVRKAMNTLLHYNPMKELIQTKNIFICKYCDKGFAQQSNLRVHERIHFGEKPFSCKYCDKTFHRSDNFKKHELDHTEKKATD